MSVANESNEVTMHEDTKKEFEYFGPRGYRFCVEDFSSGPIAWFVARFDAVAFLHTQIIVENYRVVECKEETNQ